MDEYLEKLIKDIKNINSDLVKEVISAIESLVDIFSYIKDNIDETFSSEEIKK